MSISFLDHKNLSPRLLSAALALILSVINAVMSLLLHPQWWLPLLVLTGTFIIAYSLFLYTIQRFIYRKIKLIYKFIYQTKATRKEEFFYNNILPQKSIAEVSRDVVRWAVQRKDEIELLQQNESFRKEFLMNLAHELRTPIFTAQGFIDTLMGGAVNDPEVRDRFLKNASRSIDRLVRLVDDLDEISKLESGRIPVTKTAFVIQELILDAFEELELRAAERAVSLTFKKDSERALTVLADKPKIRQVLINLIENAIKYGSEGGVVTAGCYEMDERQVYVEISDNGPGIAGEQLPRIFERFYRADRSRSRNEVGGTGLGLAIVKHLVEAHEQTVTARSKIGVGSSFGFTLEHYRD